MIKFPEHQFEKARAYIMSEGRELERARFEFLFEQGAKEEVLAKLKPYQNEDGGFGHGIEPDFWLPSSSPMATWAAGQILVEVEADKNEPMVQSMLSYLENTNRLETGMWDSVLPEVNNYPHAPWWTWREGAQENWMFNPGAELAAFLVQWSEEGSKAAQIGWSSIGKAVDHLMDKTEMDKHEINSFQQMVKLLKSHEARFDSKFNYSYSNVAEKVLDLAERCVDRNPSNWANGYKPLPLDFVDGAGHPLCERLAFLVKENLDFYIEQITEDGVWNIPWGWDSYPESEGAAMRYWRGILAVKRYKLLKAFS